ncbi:MAG: hypothetical protein MO852_00600 [Candidatus Devosia euplotis]|nr:hypothetical protein [Candidatus Devosia euplotis]
MIAAGARRIKRIYVFGAGAAPVTPLWRLPPAHPQPAMTGYRGILHGARAA